MYKKIDIFVNGRYVCSTNMSRTCREAVEGFFKRGCFGEDVKTGDKVRAYFSKR